MTAEVTLKLDDGSIYPLKGKLQMTDVTVDPHTGAVQLRAHLLGERRRLVIGTARGDSEGRRLPAVGGLEAGVGAGRLRAG